MNDRRILDYYLYFIVYWMFFLLFIKGIFPANETGILFIGFMIFMTVAFTFGATFIKSELFSRRKEIYENMELSLQEQYAALTEIKGIYERIASYHGVVQEAIDSYFDALDRSLQDMFEVQLDSYVNHNIHTQLIDVLREELNVVRHALLTAYMVSVDQFREEKMEPATE